MVCLIQIAVDGSIQLYFTAMQSYAAQKKKRKKKDNTCRWLHISNVFLWL